MPSVTFDVTWPDGEKKSYYSPSTIIREYLQPSEEYSLNDFAEKTEAALTEASERVFNKFGYYCSAAADEKQKIQSKLAELEKNNINGHVILHALK